MNQRERSSARMASTSRSDFPARDAGRRLLAAALSSLGWSMRDWRNATEEIPWLGYWYQIEWAQAKTVGYPDLPHRVE